MQIRQAIDLTQIDLVSNDRAVSWSTKELTRVKRVIMTRIIRIMDLPIWIFIMIKKRIQPIQDQDRNDMRFSDGEKVTIDDVIFSMYDIVIPVIRETVN